MRVLLISDHADPLAKIGSLDAGGQNIYVMNIASLLAKLGVEVDVYTRWDQTTKKEVVQVQPRLRVIRVRAGPKHYMPRDSFISVMDRFVANVRKRIEDEKLAYNVIFTHYWFSGLMGLELAKEYKLPLTHVYHSIGKWRFETFKHHKKDTSDSFYETRAAAERRIAHEATTIISTSPIERDAIVELFNISPSKIALIPVGVDTALFRPYYKKAVRRQLGLPLDQKIIVYAGRLEWRKGIGTLLYAVKRLTDRWHNIGLYIVGGGKTKQSRSLDAGERERLERIVDYLKLHANVTFIGGQPQTRMAMYYAAADVSAVPSYYEPFGIVPIESMASGTPVVGSRIGGIQYTIEDGMTGHLATPRDHKDLANKLNLVLRNGKETYAEAARHRVLRHFAWPKIASAAAAHLSRIAVTPKLSDQSSPLRTRKQKQRSRV